MDQLTITLPLPDSVNKIYGRNKFGSTYLKKEGKDFKAKAEKYIREQVEIQKWKALTEREYCFVDAIVFMNKCGRDSDNLFKLLLDSVNLSNVVWHDDTYALSRTNRIYIDSLNPRVEIIITPTNTIGIFDTAEEYEEFKARCNMCSRFKKTCSLHNKVIENRIISEVTKDENDKWKCCKFKQIK